MLLFDEPLSNLDAKLRGDMRIELRELQHRLGITSLYVTHDLEEALAMSDRIVVMRDGLVEQTGTPDEIYSLPRSAFVADFVGSANLITGRCARTSPRRDDRAGDARRPRRARHGLWPHARSRARFSVRTVHLRSAPPRRRRAQCVAGDGPPLGFPGRFHAGAGAWGERELVVRASGTSGLAEGQPGYLSVDPQRCVLLEAA